MDSSGHLAGLNDCTVQEPGKCVTNTAYLKSSFNLECSFRRLAKLELSSLVFSKSAFMADIWLSSRSPLSRSSRASVRARLASLRTLSLSLKSTLLLISPKHLRTDLKNKPRCLENPKINLKLRRNQNMETISILHALTRQWSLSTYLDKASYSDVSCSWRLCSVKWSTNSCWCCSIILSNFLLSWKSEKYHKWTKFLWISSRQPQKVWRRLNIFRWTSFYLFFFSNQLRIGELLGCMLRI